MGSAATAARALAARSRSIFASAKGGRSQESKQVDTEFTEDHGVHGGRKSLAAPPPPHRHGRPRGLTRDHTTTHLFACRPQAAYPRAAILSRRSVSARRQHPRSARRTGVTLQRSHARRRPPDRDLFQHQGRRAYRWRMDIIRHSRVAGHQRRAADSAATRSHHRKRMPGPSIERERQVLSMRV